MKKIILSIFLTFIMFLAFGQNKERKVEKEINQFYYEATDDYFVHQYDSAIYKLNILDFLYEDNSNVKYFLGMSYFFKSEFNTAITYFEKSLVDVSYTHDYQNGKYTPHIVYFYLGFSYEKQGNTEAAIDSYEDFIKYEKNGEVINNTKEKIKAMKLIHNIND